MLALYPSVTRYGNARTSCTTRRFAAQTFEIYHSGNSHSHNYLPLSGGTLTGSIIIKRTAVDLSKSNNNVSANTYSEVLCRDTGDRIYGCFQGVAMADGMTSAGIYARNVKSDGTAVANAVSLRVAKDGTRSVAFTDGKIWRNALGLGNTTGALPIANGGTGQTSVNAAKRALGLAKTAGDSITGLTFYGAGYLTNSKTWFQISIPLACHAYSVSGVNIVGAVSLRQNNAYFFGSGSGTELQLKANGATNISSITYEATVNNYGCIQLTIKGGTQNAGTNNDAMGFALKSATITFK